MQATKDKKSGHKKPPIITLYELDRVKLIKAVTDKGKVLDLGLRGTIVLCHGTQAYEVEFEGIDGFFQISARNLEKA